MRASRSFPFVSKVTRAHLIEITAEVLLDRYQPRSYETLELDYVGVKTSQFSYKRLKGADPVANVEMASTGEVAHIGESYLDAFFLSWLSTEQHIKGKRLLISVHELFRPKLALVLAQLENQGWDLFATEGTHRFLASRGIGSVSIYKVGEKHEPNITTLLTQKKVDLIINLPSVGEKNPAEFKIRRLAIDHHIPLITNPQLAQIFLQCLTEIEPHALPVRSWRETCCL